MAESTQGSVSSDLRWRGLIYQMSDDKVCELIDSSAAVAYVGFDPSSDSLHVGNLIQLLNLRRLQLGGNRPIAVAGGATGMIGDPSGKSLERNLLDAGQIEYNLARIEVQLRGLLDFSPGAAQAVLANNATWLSRYGVLDFLRDIGKHVTVNQMAAKDSVRVRLEERENGISFTEFSYMLLQAADFLHLWDAFGCNLQMGASDQWGNITTGIDLVRRMRAVSVYGLTSPLLLKADGTKFGKSEQGAIYLDPEKTSPFDFYQFFLRAEDAAVDQLLKFFTFRSREEIEDLAGQTQAHPEARSAQHALAQDITKLVHGEAGLSLARQASEALYSADIFAMDERAVAMALAGAPKSKITRAALAEGVPLVEIMVGSHLAKSRSEARTLIAQRGTYLNNVRVDDVQALVRTSDVLPGGRILLRRGKKDYLVLMVE